MAQGKQVNEATKSQTMETINKVHSFYKVETPCYALYCGPRQSNAPRWVLAVITKVHGTRTLIVRFHPKETLLETALGSVKTAPHIRGRK